MFTIQAAMMHVVLTCFISTSITYSLGKSFFLSFLELLDCNLVAAILTRTEKLRLSKELPQSGKVFVRSFVDGTKDLQYWTLTESVDCTRHIPVGWCALEAAVGWTNGRKLDLGTDLLKTYACLLSLRQIPGG
jgi:hypothetical protein